jgi:hypothetical protein
MPDLERRVDARGLGAVGCALAAAKWLEEEAGGECLLGIEHRN